MNTYGSVSAGQSAARRLLLALLLTIGLGSSIATSVIAADKSLGSFKVWSAMSFAEDEKTVCMMWSQPEKDEGEYKKRGEIFVFVTHRPGDKQIIKESFDTGYTFKDPSRSASPSMERHTPCTPMAAPPGAITARTIHAWSEPCAPVKR